MDVALQSVKGRKLIEKLIGEAVAAKTRESRTLQTRKPPAVPDESYIPATGGFHESPDVAVKPAGGVVSYDKDGGFHWKNNQTMADVALEQLREGRGSTGAPYNRKTKEE
jgi:hypothetical protein